MKEDIKKVEQLKKEIEQKKARMKLLEQKMKTDKRKEETRKKIVTGGNIEMIDKITDESWLKYYDDPYLLIGILTNRLYMKRYITEADFLRSEGEKIYNRYQEQKKQEKNNGKGK